MTRKSKKIRGRILNNYIKRKCRIKNVKYEWQFNQCNKFLYSSILVLNVWFFLFMNFYYSIFHKLIKSLFYLACIKRHSKEIQIKNFDMEIGVSNFFCMSISNYFLVNISKMQLQWRNLKRINAMMKLKTFCKNAIQIIKILS